MGGRVRGGERLREAVAYVRGYQLLGWRDHLSMILVGKSNTKRLIVSEYAVKIMTNGHSV